MKISEVMQLIRKAGLLVWVAAFTTHLSALTWERVSQEFTLEAGAGDLIAEFPFKNERAKAVTITETKASCGCTTPTVDSRVIPAGGKGVIKVTYAPGDRVGPQSSLVTITTDEAGVAPATLQMHIQIEPAIVLTPRLVLWTKADELVGRTISIKRMSKAPVRVLEPKLNGDALTVDLKPGAEPDSWLLTLTPKAVETPFTTKVEIPVVVGERTVTYSAFAVVR